MAWKDIAMPVRDSRDVKVTLQQMEVHNNWAGGYRTPENDAFYNTAFDYLASVYGEPGTRTVLDAGCGTATKSIHLARRGYSVLAVDISERILESARQEIERCGLGSTVRCQWEDLTAMTFPDRSFSRVLCWGVLMHVPEVEMAITELVRITKAGGIIVISEGNVRSIQAVALRWLKSMLGRQRAEVHGTEAGIEFWEETSTGKLVTRQTDMGWLIRAFEARGAELVERRAGQFTEIFTLLPWRPLRHLVHVFNNFWFCHLRYPGPAFGNLLIFRKAI